MTLIRINNEGNFKNFTIRFVTLTNRVADQISVLHRVEWEYTKSHRSYGRSFIDYSDASWFYHNQTLKLLSK